MNNSGFIKLPDGAHAFIDTFQDDGRCPKGGQHDDEGAVVMYRTRKGETRYINQDKYLDKPRYDKKGRIYYPPKRIHRRMVIVGGSVACSKCGSTSFERFNPFFAE
jgi:hypothetical protein